MRSSEQRRSKAVDTHNRRIWVLAGVFTKELISYNALAEKRRRVLAGEQPAAPAHAGPN